MIGGAMKSLFKSGARDLKAKVSKSTDDDEFPTPLGLRIGAAVDVDTLPLRMHADDLRVDLPEETILIAAQGYIELGDDTFAHRYYSADDAMIQVLTVAGVEDHHVKEMTLYVPFKSYYPDGASAWSQWIGRAGKLGAPTFTLEDSTTFDRVWFDGTEGQAEPVAFTESVYEDPESDDHSKIFHQVMLYGRNLDDGKKNEYLLVSAESYEAQKTIELMVGVDLEFSSLRVF